MNAEKIAKALDISMGMLSDMGPGGWEVAWMTAIQIVQDTGLRYEDYPSWSYWMIFREHEEAGDDIGLDLDALGVPTADAGLS